VEYARTARSGSGTGVGRSRLGYQFADPVRHLGTFRHPVFDTVALEIDCRWVGTGIVGPHDLDRTPVARALLLNDYHAIMRLLARTPAR